ncbi:MAG: DUF3613 domain-containing protein [Gallionellaceae bacterium]|nr:DUF3613 domain-containing protein [Gallionellaceae bacterium]
MANKSYFLAAALGLCALSAALPGYADDAAAQPEPQVQPIVIGATTENLLKMQREGTSAANLQPISGEVASLSYRRYLDSFAKPMPEFKETVASSTKSGSGESN